MRKRKILLASPGSLYSTTDVYEGLAEGFEALGVQVERFDTLREITLRENWLRWSLEAAGMGGHLPPTTDELFQILRSEGDIPADYADFFTFLRREVLDQLVVRARREKHDLVVIISGHNLNREALDMMSLRADTPLGRGFVRTALVCTESPYEDERQAKQGAVVDHLFVNDEASVGPLSEVASATFLPTAWRPTLHFPREASRFQKRDLVFVGVGYPERVEFLEGIDWTGIDASFYGDWRFVSEDSPIRPLVRPGIIPNETTTELYLSARVGLNLYRECVDYWRGGTEQNAGTSPNPRAFELAACGLPQVSNERAGHRKLFGDSCLATDDPCEAEQMIRELLADPDERKRVADAQRARVQGHSYTDRAQTIMEVCFANP